MKLSNFGFIKRIRFPEIFHEHRHLALSFIPPFHPFITDCTARKGKSESRLFNRIAPCAGRCSVSALQPSSLESNESQFHRENDIMRIIVNCTDGARYICVFTYPIALEWLFVRSFIRSCALCVQAQQSSRKRAINDDDGNTGKQRGACKVICFFKHYHSYVG